jgi:putative ABC transport system permease protein
VVDKHDWHFDIAAVRPGGLPSQATPNAHLIRAAEGIDTKALSSDLESSFLSNGLEATLLEDELRPGQSTEPQLPRTGFLGLGLDRRRRGARGHQRAGGGREAPGDGVMRAIGFEQGMVQLSFLIESSMVALAGILIGTALGLVIAFNVIQDSKADGSWENLSFVVPWLNFCHHLPLVYGAALATSFLPARQASRVYRRRPCATSDFC